MRSTFKHGSSQPAGVVSDIFAYGLAPATCIGLAIAIPLLLHRRVAADSSERPTAATRWLRGAMVSTTEVPGGRIVGIGWGF